jgi:hypothetical protein
VIALASLAAAVWVVMFRMPGTSWDGPAPPVGAADAPLRTALESDVRALAETIGERSVFQPERLEAAARHVESRFAEVGLAPRRETYEHLAWTLSNVVAEVAGRTRPSQIVVVGAHYDSVRGTPGANDNATGVAATLALARHFARSPAARTLRFVAFTGEEPPLFLTEGMGSLVHARGCAARGEDVVAMLALETLGCFRDGEGTQEYPIRGMGLFYPARGDFVSFVGDVASGLVVRDAIAAFRRHAKVPSEGAALPMSVPGVGWSDHWSFRQAGFPSVMVTDTAIFRDSAYHTLRDTCERVDFDRLTHVTQGLVPVVEALAGAD